MYVLDTDHLGILQRRTAKEHTALLTRMAQHPADGFFVSIISFQEQFNGWNAFIQRARTIDELARGYGMFASLLLDFGRMNVLPFDAPAAEQFSQFRKLGVRIGTMDLRIGAIASVHGFTVLTRNTVDFERIPGLRIEDWTIHAG